MTVKILADDVQVVRYSQIERSLGQGATAAWIAHELSVSVPTLRWHLVKMGFTWDDVRGWHKTPRA